MDWRRRETPKARKLRKTATPAERALWPWLRNRRLYGFKFRRQFVISPYIVDLACPEARLIIELDGAGHQFKTEEDARRQAYLERLGWRVLRFGNHEVTCLPHAVLEAIVAALGR